MGNANGGTLTITGGTHTANIALEGNYLSSGWTLSSDGHGGTIVVDPAAPTITSLSGYGAVTNGGMTADDVLTLDGAAAPNSIVTVFDGTNVARNGHGQQQWQLAIYDWSTRRRLSKFYCD